MQLARIAQQVAPRDNQFELVPEVRSVIPFSDGMDSWAVATLDEFQRGKGLLRVRLGLRAPPQRRDRTRPPAFSYVPYKVHVREYNSIESAVRSRGFRFALISGIAASLAGTTSIIIPKSGQAILAPALLPSGRAYPDYRSHPLFLAKVQHVVEALFGRQVEYKFPMLWKTKGETLSAAVSAAKDGTERLRTRSCWQKSRHISVDGEQRQCGICAACLLRRLSVHATRLEEPSSAYTWENLSALEFRGGASPLFSKITGALERHAVGGTWLLNRFALLDQSSNREGILRRSAAVLSGALDVPRLTIEERQQILLRSHREEWEHFLVTLGLESFITRWTLAV